MARQIICFPTPEITFSSFNKSSHEVQTRFLQVGHIYVIFCLQKLSDFFYNQLDIDKMILAALKWHEKKFLTFYSYLQIHVHKILR